jgi:F-type H+-transporting ATPase subunit epsilon
VATNEIPTTLELQIVTPDRNIIHDQVDEVEIPGVGGYFGVLPGHAPLLAALTAGELWFRKGQEKTFLSVAFGFAEVLPERVTILARLAERAEEIDVARAEAARKRAEDRIAHPESDIDYKRNAIALMKALARIQVSSRAGALSRLAR